MSDVRVRFLGSGDAFGSGGRMQTCIYVEAAATRFLFDCGASSLIAMKRFGVDPNGIDAVLVTHLHGDHFGGLPFLILNAQFSRRDRPLTIAGPPGLETRVHEAMEVLFPSSSQTRQRFPLEFVELSGETSVALGSLTVQPFTVVHASGAPAYAWRSSCDGKVVSYSGDTEWTDALIRAAEGADLFICEAYYFEKQVRYHLDYQTLMAHRADLHCRRLVLTHMNVDMLNRLDSIAGEYAEDGMSIVL